jgi:hypothetical protein
MSLLMTKKFSDNNFFRSDGKDTHCGEYQLIII